MSGDAAATGVNGSALGEYDYLIKFLALGTIFSSSYLHVALRTCRTGVIHLNTLVCIINVLVPV